MKALLLVVVAIALSGCAVYPAGYGGGDRHGYTPRVHDRDRDRDRDGVPNRWDAQPNNPRRR